MTPDEIVKGLEQSAEALEVLSEMRDLTFQQNEQRLRQQRAAARGALFYIVVGFGSAGSGIAGIVALDDPADRRLVLGLLLALAMLTAGAYLLVGAWQRREDSSD